MTQDQREGTGLALIVIAGVICAICVGSVAVAFLAILGL